MEEQFISCILATHNDGRYLTESISSILGQTYKNIECIVIDDGSTDDTATFVERWLGDPRFSYVNQAQSGVAKARNAGVRKSSGGYLAFLDADDRWDPNKLDLQLRFLAEHPEYGFCWSDQELMDDSGKPLGKRVEFNPQLPLTRHILTTGWNAPPSCLLVKRELIEKIGGFDENLPSGEDTEFAFRMSDCSQGARSDKAFVWRRVRPNSISRNDVASKRVQAVRVYKQMLAYKHGKYRSMRREAMFSVHRFLAGHCWENGAHWAATVEALYAVLWEPRFFFDRDFIDTVVLGHVIRILKAKK